MKAQLCRLIVLSLMLLAPDIRVLAACDSLIRGINLVPLPTGWFKGAVEIEFPTDAQIRYYKNVGMNAIRLPIVWETVQPTLNGELSSRYLDHALDFVAKANTQGMKVLIDLHAYGRYQGKVIGTSEVPASAFKNIWKRLATAFSKSPAIYAYGLMNEPHDTNGLWHTVAQAGVDGIRSVDTDRVIYVSGDSWSNSQLWPKVNPEPFVTDTSNRVVYEAHLYFDDEFSGHYKTPSGTIDLTTRTEQRLLPFIDWLKTHGQHGAIGEIGVPMDDRRWMIALGKFLEMSDASCLDWFMWAGGRWRDAYELSLEPINGRDRPQIELIRSRIARERK